MSRTSATAELHKELPYQRLVPTAVAAASHLPRLANRGLAGRGGRIGAQTGGRVKGGSLGGV